ncbi:phage terminase small subunit [Methylobacter sp. G7]|uniref:phage terminase small subunit n=1 Tax=Methylobacter sp. G7 TaxID=3230117 RepID=UPI003D806D98
MTSPARRHLARIAAATAIIGFDPAAKGGNRSTTTIVNAQLADYQAAMAIDLAKIKAEPTLEGKARIKQTVLPTYLGFVDEYMDKAHNYPNDVAVLVMIWLLDIGSIEIGLNLALFLVKQQQKMPERFNRPMPEFLCDFIYDWANVELKAEHSASPYLDQLIAAAEADKWDMNPLFLSKLYSMLAKHKKRNGDYAEALALCLKAEAINPDKAGVKGMKEELQKLLDQAALSAQS